MINQLQKENEYQIKVDIPKSQDFIHICYVELAREVWSKPQIMYDGLSNEIRKVYEIELDTIIESIIMKVIKNLLPLEKIVNGIRKRQATLKVFCVFIPQVLVVGRQFATANTIFSTKRLNMKLSNL